VSLFRWATELVRDLHYGVRNLARSRGLTTIAAASLALGIGGSTAMYSVIYAVILDPFPYKDPHRLMSVTVRGAQVGGNGGYYSIDQFRDISDRNRTFDGVIASTYSDVMWSGAGDPQRLRGNHCTMNTFDVMGVPPLIGRTTTASDAVDGAEPVTVLGYKFWQRAFGGDPGVLGRKLRINDKLRTVIGVMPPRFMWRGADVYLPDVLHSGQAVEGVNDFHLLGRLKPGISREQVEADLRPILNDLQRQRPDDFPKTWRLQIRDFGETFPSGIQDALWMLFGAVGVLLLIACVNVSNLLLSRAAYRRREFAIRASMGAGRLRLVRQLLAESLVLGLGGGALGVLVAWAGLRGIVAMVPPDTIPDEAQITLNMPVLLFTAALCAASAILFGLAPAVQLSGGDLVTPLRDAGRGTSAGRGQRFLRGALVVGEVALSLMLLVGASLMIRTLIRIQGANFAFHPERILTMRIPLTEQRYPDSARRNAFLQDVLRRVQAVPGVAAAGINGGLPPVYSWTFPVALPGTTQPDSQRVMLQQVNVDYTKVMGVVCLRGRLLSEQEVDAQIHSAVVNQAFERRYFSGGDAIGQVVRMPALRAAPFHLRDDSFQIVGVVKDSVNRAATNETWPEMFVPFTILGRADRIVVQANGRPEALSRAVKAQVYAADPVQPVTEDQTLERVLGQNVYARPRFNLLLFSVFGFLGLALALFGVYGVISHAVAQQTREIGIRIALGATFGEVIGMVLGIGAKLLGIGIGLGLAASLASVKLLSRLVGDISTFDPYSFAAVTVVLFAAGLFAAYWPARKAARIDPIGALRE
jgi:putative ABC transport system permease protein